MATAVAKAPKAVSPLIKGARWSALIAGIMYGHYKHKKYTKLEKDTQAYENPIKERQAKKAQYEKDIFLADQMNDLAKEFGVPTRVEKPAPPKL